MKDSTSQAITGTAYTARDFIAVHDWLLHVQEYDIEIRTQGASSQASWPLLFVLIAYFRNSPWPLMDETKNNAGWF